MKKWTTEQFISFAQSVHGNKYNYSLANYTYNKAKIIIICKNHGEFLQRSYDHLRGHGCKKCVSNTQKLTIDDFIKKSNSIHGNKYSYEEVVYTNNKTKVLIRCKKHGLFEQKPKAWELREYYLISSKRNYDIIRSKITGIEPLPVK